MCLCIILTVLCFLYYIWRIRLSLFLREKVDCLEFFGSWGFLSISGVILLKLQRFYGRFCLLWDRLFPLNYFLCVSELTHQAKNSGLDIVWCLWFHFGSSELLPETVYSWAELNSQWAPGHRYSCWCTELTRTPSPILFCLIVQHWKDSEEVMLPSCLQLPIRDFSLEAACFEQKLKWPSCFSELPQRGWFWSKVGYD